MDTVPLHHQTTRYQHYLVRRIKLPQNTPQIFGALFRPLHQAIPFNHREHEKRTNLLLPAGDLCVQHVKRFLPKEAHQQGALKSKAIEMKLCKWLCVNYAQR